jgi:signal transduction histidine kinase/integral membrane sensor domain MASE1/ActR/RegA family two-component response regulator
MGGRLRVDLAGIAIVAAVYYCAAKLGFLVAFVAEQVSPVWPPTGIALSALLLVGPRVWPGVAIGAFLANVTTHESIATAFGIASGNTLEAVAGAWLLRRLIGFDCSLHRFKDAVGLVILAAGVSTTVSATIGTTSLCLGGAQPWAKFGSLWAVWWLGDAMGDLVFAPAILVWSTAWRQKWTAAAVGETLALLVALILLAVGVFGIATPHIHMQHAYLIFPVVIWAAVRVGQPGATTATLLISIIAIVGTARGRGPFQGHSPSESLDLLQYFMATVAATGLLLAAAMSERTEAQQRVRESDEQSRFTLEAAHVGTWEWNLKTGQVRWSDNMESLHGLARGQFGGNLDAAVETVHPVDRDALFASIRSAVDAKGEFHVEYRTLHRDPPAWIEGRGRVIVGPSDEPLRMLGICVDVTQRKEAVQALVESDRRKDTFLATLAHELRNPLAPISNAMQYFRLKGGPVEPDVQQFTDIIERQTRQMTRLVDDLLDISRINRDKLELRKESVDLASVVQTAVETARPALKAQGHQFSVELPAEPILLQADPVRLAQVFSNLLHNAAKFTPPGGRIELCAERGQNEVVVTLRDNGVGIPPAQLSHVFEMFTQAGEATHQTLGGLGIGLALSRRLVEMHGGTIEAHSEGNGRGSEFRVRLPAHFASPAPKPRPPGPARARALGNHYRILVVDDNKDSAESLSLLLSTLGSDVRQAYDGQEAIEAAEAFRPEIILLDIGMPVMNGYEAARGIRSREWGSDVVLVALTGWGQEEDRRRSTEAGFDWHLTKPVDVSALKKLLDELAGRTPSRSAGP